jgi:hypothetical protein
MFLRVLPSTRDLITIVVTVLLTLSLTNLFRTAEAGVESSPSTDVVFIATGANFPDALGAAAAAGALLAPVLLVTSNSVPPATLDELNDLMPQDIFVVGGPAVISDDVIDDLEALSFLPTVTRISGANRYETAAALSDAMFPTQGYYPLAAYSGGAQFRSVTATDAVVRSVTLTAPVDGTVIVNSTVNANESTAGDTVLCSITTGTSLDNAFLQLWESPGSDGRYGQLAGTRGFAVTAGEELTVNLVCYHFGDSGSSDIRNSALTAIFVADI